MSIFIIILVLSILCIIVKVSSSGNSQTECTSSHYSEPPKQDEKNSIPPRGTPYTKTTVISTSNSGAVTMEKSITETCFNGYIPKPHPQLQPAYYYKVNGKNTLTNRRKTLTIYAYSEADAKRRAELQALAEPFNIERLDNNPTERQIAAAKEAEILLPPNATKDDVSNIFGLLFDKEPEIKQDTVNYVIEHDIVISPYATQPRAEYIIKKSRGVQK